MRVLDVGTSTGEVTMGTSGARIEQSIGHRAQDLGGVFLASLILIRNVLYEVGCWVRDEWRLNAAIRELSRLNDDYLDDIGIKRRHLHLQDEALVKRLRTGDRNPPIHRRTYGQLLTRKQ
jgi:uncharacterized protein YjiS (DUF1127 family)